MARMESNGADGAAAEWFVRLQDCEDEQLWLDHLAWLEADPAHSAAYARVEALWVAADGLADLPADRGGTLAVQEGAEVVSFVDRHAARERRRSWWLPMSAVAAAAAVVALVAGPQIGGLFAPAGQTYRNGGDHAQVVALSDGSRLTLNRDSEVTVTLVRDGRTAELTTGEVIFDVHREPDRPFTVRAGGRDVRVLGTEFDVLNQEGAFAVVVRRGLVSVSDGNGNGPDARLPAGTALTRAPGQSADTITRVDPGAAMAWEKGQLVFADQPIQSIARDLSRYLRTPVAVDPAVRHLRVSGVLSITDPATLRRQVEAVLPVRVRTTDTGMILVPAD
ncbi:FecR family protein [Sphingomonas sp. Leaf10]|uniref:FecR family protein n=1 Tax=Sphingomonas sp. Leaf10 TaxID=1735676 RepID=UPI0012E308A2|nr:FecR domain-containing protein [Sphingomonas sp. Leaf10]